MILLVLIPLTASAGLGIFINGAYYRSSFINANYGDFYALILAVAFMLFEAVLWLYIGRRFWISFLKTSIVVFSIATTLGAQFFSTSIKETEFQKEIVSGTEAEIAYYRNQIEKQDNRIDSIFREREEKTIYTLSSEPLKVAEEKKAEYEKILFQLLSSRDEKTGNISAPKTLYYWLAYDLPEIFRSGISENMIRLSFQLFSSVLLALMAPVSLSMIRITINKRNGGPAAPAAVQSKIQTVDKDIKRIADMILYKYPEDKLIDPETASQYFGNIHKGKPEIPHYSIEECQKVYDLILPLKGKSKIDIKKEIFNYE